MKMQLGFLIPNARFTVDGLKLLHLKKVIKIRHVLLMKVIGAFSGEAFNHMNIHVGKRVGLVEIVVNNYGSHAVVRNLSSFRGVENILRAAAPTGQVFRPDVMVTLLGFKVFARHDRPFHWVLVRKLSAYEPRV